MRDYIKRFLIAGIMAIFVSLLFLGGRHPQASMLNSNTAKSQWIWPAEGVISDTFGTRQGKHKGLDIAGELNSPIFAVDAGTVEKSYYSDTYGNVVFISHSSGYVTIYAHLSSRLVNEGQQVKKGEIIGKMGMTGQATGVHLHFETHKSEWTFDKKYAFDPERLLGTAKMGDVVQVGAAKEGQPFLEASTHLHDQADRQTIVPEREKQISSSTAKKQTYLVKSGDTLSTISAKYHLSIEKIKELNKLSSDRILSNQVLMITK